VVGDAGSPRAPGLVGDACFVSDVGEGAVVVVMEESGFGRGGFTGHRIGGGTADEIDVEPAVVVVVDEANAGAVGFNDEFLFGSAHGVLPGGQASGGGNVLKDDGAGLDEAARSDRAILLIEDRGVNSPGV